jgi:deazaflavin-dependent oxidoreductase (nitroreductase family)
MSSAAHVPAPTPASAPTGPEPGPASFHHRVIEEFRANGGKVGGPFEGSDLLLLTTTGAKSGRPHTVPLGHVPDEDGRLLLTASNLGSPHHPAWYHNVLAHPAVEVEVGTTSFGAVAVPAEGAHRDRLFERIVRAW